MQRRSFLGRVAQKILAQDKGVVLKIPSPNEKSQHARALTQSRRLCIDEQSPAEIQRWDFSRTQLLQLSLPSELRRPDRGTTTRPMWHDRGHGAEDNALR